MVDLPWGDPRTIKFATNVGLITSTGPHGDNIMSAEWTHQVSYSPGLIAVAIGRGKASLENIEKTKEFGVNLAALDQAGLASIAGTNHGNEVNKVAALKELGYKFFKAKKIKPLMVEGAVMQAECKLVKIVDIGDHPILIGEIVELYPVSNKESLVYHGQKFWKLTETLPSPNEKEMERIKVIIAKHQK